MKQESTLVHLFKRIGRRISDAARERKIERLRKGLVSVKNPALRLAIFGLMREEIEARSAEQVARMERERGLS